MKPQETITYIKLKSGGWGLRSPIPLTEGTKATITTKNGKHRMEKVGKKVWSNGEAYLYVIPRFDHYNKPEEE